MLNRVNLKKDDSFLLKQLANYYLITVYVGYVKENI